MSDLLPRFHRIDDPWESGGTIDLVWTHSGLTVMRDDCGAAPSDPDEALSNELIELLQIDTDERREAWAAAERESARAWWAAVLQLLQDEPWGTGARFTFHDPAGRCCLCGGHTPAELVDHGACSGCLSRLAPEHQNQMLVATAQERGKIRAYLDSLPQASQA